MNATKHRNDITAIGNNLLDQWGLYDIEILREDYSVTIDWGREMAEPIRIQLERAGFEVIHERESIYTLKSDYQV